MKRVLHITHLYPKPYDPMLGITMHHQVKTLQEFGWFSKVIAPVPWSPFPVNRFSQKWEAYSRVPRYDVIEGIEVYYPRYLAFPKAWFFTISARFMYFSILSVAKKIREAFSFDLIHAHMALPDGFAAMLLSELFGIPFVVTYQATDTDITLQRGTGCASMLHTVFKSAAAVISPSPRLTQDFVALFGFKPTDVPYGIYLEDIVDAPSSFPLTKYQDKRVLLSVSRLLPTKGIDLVLRALPYLVQKYDNLQYVIVGDGGERVKLEEMTRDLNLTQYVDFIGWVPHERAMEYMARADVFTLPSWQETFGLVYIEAMAHGKPIVAVKGQGVDGIVRHGETGLLVKPRDVNALVKAIDFLFSHPEEARAMGKRARKLVLENYTWEKNAEKTIKVYEEVLNGA
ncbi:MAG TPA: glycosyltransferase family 4 protein [Chloroflexi bacterium]|nr:glycosyltransferase family 4 protein [Chloroflexota bacterium]